MINLFEEKADLLENETEAIAPVVVAAIVIVAACWPQDAR